MYTVRVGFKVNEVRPIDMYLTDVVRGCDPHSTIGMSFGHVNDFVRKIATLFAPSDCAQGSDAQSHTCIKVSKPDVSHAKQTVGVDVIYTEGCFASSEARDAFIERVENLMNKANALSQPTRVSA